MNRDVLQEASETARFIASRIINKPKIGIVLDLGLSALADEIKEDRIEIPYSEIPNFPTSKIDSNINKLVIGKIYDKDVIIMQGRFNYYEGYELDDVTFPIRVFALLGVEQLINTNSASAINKKFNLQDLMIIKDHINVMGLSPLRGDNEEVFGTRFPSMADAYSPRLIELAKDVASLKAYGEEFGKKVLKKSKEIDDLIIDLQEGVYAFMPGPQYETRAEAKMLEVIGADAVSMSLVPETIVARHMGMEVIGISCITNVVGSENLSINDDIVENAYDIEEKFKSLIMRLIMKL